MNSEIEVGNMVVVEYKTAFEVVAIEFDDSGDRIIICKNKSGKIFRRFASEARKIDIELYPKVKNFEGEYWVDIGEYYQISNFGRIKSMNYRGTTGKQGILISASPIKLYSQNIIARRIGLIKKYINPFESPELVEEWKMIEYQGEKYLVSNQGQVKTLNIYEKKIGYLYDKDGVYFQYKYYDFLMPYFYICPITLYINKQPRKTGILVHHLVAMAHVPNPNHFCFSRHKNHLDYTNNCSDNIEWCESEFDFNSIPILYNRIKFDLHEAMWRVDLSFSLSHDWEVSGFFISERDAINALKKNDKKYIIIEKCLLQSGLYLDNLDKKAEEIYNIFWRDTINFESTIAIEQFIKKIKDTISIY